MAGSVVKDVEATLREIAERDDPLDLVRKLIAEQKELRTLRKAIVPLSKKNFFLEKELKDLDEKIKLLIRNQITVQELLSQSAVLGDEQHGTGVLQERLHSYEALFYVLQTTPCYFARMAPFVPHRDIDDFVQTVVFDMYGDQYDSREERLLLLMYHEILEKKFAKAEDTGSFMRQNDAITRMLSAYARRGLGLNILRDILAEPLIEICKHKDLDLEIRPAKVYKRIKQNYETTTGKKWELASELKTEEDAARNPHVARLIAPRIKQRMQIAQVLLDRIIAGVDMIPYGMRWICKTLATLARKRFPDIDRYKVGSLIGGYVYLRFFNPVIVAPHMADFVERPSKTVSQNLIGVAKILQNLSNGVFFGNKEECMLPLNDFIRDNTERIQDYFEQLIDVEDLDGKMELDALMEQTSGESSVQMKYNQIFLIHRLLAEHEKSLTTNPQEKPDSALLELTRELGAAPAKLENKDNHTVTIRLVARWEDGAMRAEQFSKNRSQTVTRRSILDEGAPSLDIKVEQGLRNLLNHPKCPHVSYIAQPETRSNFKLYMETLAAQAKEADDALSSQVTYVMNNIRTFIKQCAEQDATPESFFATENAAQSPDVWNAILLKIAKNSHDRRTILIRHKHKAETILAAKTTITKHHKTLKERLDAYKMVVDNIKQQPQAYTQKGKNKSTKKKTEKKKGKKQKLKMKYDRAKDLISKVDPSVELKELKRCVFVISQLNSSEFTIEVLYKRVVAIPVLDDPLLVKLEDLLVLQQEGREHWAMENGLLTLNVNLLIHLLRTEFLAKR